MLPQRGRSLWFFSITIDYCYLLLAYLWHSFSMSTSSSCVLFTWNSESSFRARPKVTRHSSMQHKPPWSWACKGQSQVAPISVHQTSHWGKFPNCSNITKTIWLKCSNIKISLKLLLNSTLHSWNHTHLGMLCRWCIHVCFGATLSEVDPTAESCAMCQWRLLLKAILEDGNDVCGGCPDMVDLQMINKLQKQLQLCC